MRLDHFGKGLLVVGDCRFFCGKVYSVGVGIDANCVAVVVAIPNGLSDANGCSGVGIGIGSAGGVGIGSAGGVGIRSTGGVGIGNIGSTGVIGTGVTGIVIGVGGVGGVGAMGIIRVIGDVSVGVCGTDPVSM